MTEVELTQLQGLMLKLVNMMIEFGPDDPKVDAFIAANRGNGEFRSLAYTAQRMKKATLRPDPELVESLTRVRR